MKLKINIFYTVVSIINYFINFIYYYFIYIDFHLNIILHLYQLIIFV